MLSHFNHVQLIATLCTVAYQAPLSMGFSRQEYWSGLPCLPPGDLPNPGLEPMSHMSPALVGGFFTTSATGKPILIRVPGWGGGNCNIGGKSESRRIEIMVGLVLTDNDKV